MKHGKKRLLSLFLALCMILTMLPAPALAAELAPPEEPTAVAVDDPAENPPEEPTADPEDVPVEEPAEEPVEESTEAPAEEPTDALTAEPAEEPTDTPVEEPTDAPTDSPAEEPVNDSPADPVDEPEETAPVELEIEGKTQTYVPDADDLPDNDELFAGYVERTFYGESGIATLGDYGASTLSVINLELYNALKTEITKVAANGGSTKFTITLATPITWDSTATSNDELGVEASTAFQNAGISQSKIVRCLLTDCPYELYWYDKVSGSSMGYSSSASGGTGTISSITFTFKVATAYRGSDNATVDSSKATAAASAADTAQGVVSANASKSNYEKLVAYKEYICNAVSYNSDAASDSYTGGYGDPWQLIYVFDGDSSTNVVCEGYSKAFQYLCDLGGLTCYSVTGTMSGGTGAGAHMWNIVTLDGANYLVDVTNSDTGTVGAYGGLFLAGAPNGTAEGYTISIPSYDLGGGSSTVVANITYAYDEDTTALYNSTILKLAEADYTEPEPVGEPVAEVTLGGKTTYYTDIQEAFSTANAGTADHPATVTLLADVELPKDSCVSITGVITLVGGAHTLSGQYAYGGFGGLLFVWEMGNLTIQSGTYRNEASNYGHAVFTNGTLRIEGGTFISTNTGVCLAAYSTKVTLTGGTFQGSTGGGNLGPVNHNNDGTIGDLLGKGYVFYNQTTGNYYGVGYTETQLMEYGTYVVIPCSEHEFESVTDNGDGTHTGTCELCGLDAIEPHTYGTDGKCTAEGCTAQVVATVRIGEETTYYRTIETAWEAAQAAESATITLLADVDIGDESLAVYAGDNITLTSEKNADGEDYTISCSATDGYSIGLFVYGGAATISGGSISGDSFGVYVTGGAATISGGSISSVNGAGVYVCDSGTATITGGNISGVVGVSVEGDGTAEISGGDISGESIGVSVYYGTVTISGGNISGVAGVSVEGGTVTISDGSISGDNVGVFVYNGTTTITGGSITATDYGSGLVVENSTAKLSGGTFSGAYAAIECSSSVSQLLDTTQEGKHFAYYDDADQLIISGLDGSTLTGTVKVDKCTHIDSDSDGLCDICGGKVLVCEHYEDISEYRNGEEYISPVMAGYVFAGWYADADLTTPISEDTTGGKAYAKFVDEEVLAVKWQIRLDTIEDGTTDLRLITTVDSLDYQNVGFQISFGETFMGERVSTTVYEQIAGWDGTFVEYDPTLFSEQSRYFMVYRFLGIPESDFDTEFEVNAIWTTLDGTRIVGPVNEFKISDDSTLSAQGGV